ncbi:hypothetical protein G6F16_004368 [Rhizopus arrhizus]|nr:hypothetical protein G6F23_005213 [Rhizopus arrhizus]KAG0767396.1 hypothetical protein G6F24_002831 [Rhizopus arrhizus]KAG0796840.1 hypothetical protein G6F21_001002 [Rhizopus arrhizus]KAG0815325.1 hypothetical protein G6F20_004084 [Rhizopus arrhizus]KAG0836465.1 hypothetical protein G6F19_004224 [Rhizopus arrhizus]
MYLSSRAFFLISSVLLQIASVTASKCVSKTTDFTKSHNGWKEISDAKKGVDFTAEGLKLTLYPPEKYVPAKNASQDGLPYNKYTSPYAPNFQFENLIQYGRVSFELKTAGAPGVVTAAILMSPGGDEIDFEMLGGDPKKVQTNYFYGKNIVYGVNGGNHDSEDTTSGFHTYTIDWSPTEIKYLIDNKEIRKVRKADTCKRATCEYPTEASAIQIGIWDASNPSDTAEWAKGPVDWKKYKSISAIIKSVKIECGSN